MRDCWNAFADGCVVALVIGLAIVAVGLTAVEIYRELSGQIITF